MRIRQATGADAAQLSAFAELTFRETFAPDNDPAQIDLYCRKTFSVGKQLAELQRENATTLVACDETGLVGYAQIRFDDDDRSEIERFYVHSAHHGRGIAQQLMQSSMDLAKDKGYKVLWLGVWEHNKRAIAFYEKMGFKKTGEHAFMLGTEEQTDHVMARTLS